MYRINKIKMLASLLKMWTEMKNTNNQTELNRLKSRIENLKRDMDVTEITAAIEISHR